MSTYYHYKMSLLNIGGNSKWKLLIHSKYCSTPFLIKGKNLTSGFPKYLSISDQKQICLEISLISQVERIMQPQKAIELRLRNPDLVLEKTSNSKTTCQVQCVYYFVSP